jgi:hypothetical protein
LALVHFSMDLPIDENFQKWFIQHFKFPISAPILFVKKMHGFFERTTLITSSLVITFTRTFQSPLLLAWLIRINILLITQCWSCALSLYESLFQNNLTFIHVYPSKPFILETNDFNFALRVTFSQTRKDVFFILLVFILMKFSNLKNN